MGMGGMTQSWSPVSAGATQTGPQEPVVIQVNESAPKKKDDKCFCIMIIILLLLLLCLGGFGLWWYVTHQEVEEDPSSEPQEDITVNKPKPKQPPKPTPVIPPPVPPKPIVIPVPAPLPPPAPRPRPPPRPQPVAPRPRPVPVPRWKQLLRQWGLEHYIDNFIEQGLEDFRHWNSLNSADCKRLFRRGNTSALGDRDTFCRGCNSELGYNIPTDGTHRVGMFKE